MSDPSQNASLLELSAQIEELRNAMPKAPVTELTRTDFFMLKPTEQSEFIRGGGKVCNDPPAPRAPLPKNGIRREDFDKMSHPERHKLIIGGSIVVD
jgi:hypothetical protein